MATPTKKQKTNTDTVVPSKAVVADFNKLEDLQEKIDKVTEEAADAIVKLERKFYEQKVPLFKERNQMLKTIPSFWKKALINHPQLSDCFNEEDENVLEYVEELECEDYPEGTWKISFKFKPNPYFKNAVVSKELKFDKDEQPSLESTKIEYKEGQSLSEGFFSMFFDGKDNNEEQAIEVVDIIKEEIWPNPTPFYHGLTDPEIIEEEGGEEDGEEEEEEEEDT